MVELSVWKQPNSRIKWAHTHTSFIWYFSLVRRKQKKKYVNSHWHFQSIRMQIHYSHLTRSIVCKWIEVQKKELLTFQLQISRIFWRKICMVSFLQHLLSSYSNSITLWSLSSSDSRKKFCHSTIVLYN